MVRSWMEALKLDLFYAARLARKNPGFSLLVVAAMGLGAASATLMFAVLNATMLRPLGYADEDRLVMVWDQMVKLKRPEWPTSYGTYQDYRLMNRSFKQMAGFSPQTVTALFADRSERLPIMQVTANFLGLLGVRPIAGRDFLPGEDERGKNGVVLLSHGFWIRRFGASPGALGQTINLDNRVYEIAGVLPPTFHFRLSGWEEPALLLPMPIEADPDRSRGSVRVLARLKPEVSLEQARQEMRALARRLEAEQALYRGPNGEDAGYTIGVVPLREQLFGAARRSVLLLFAATLLMLLVVAVNVGHLFLEWRTRREQEAAIRLSLGATRGRLLQQSIIHALVLTLSGGALATALTFVGARLLLPVLPAELSALDGLPIDWRVLLFTLAICALSGCGFGALPGARLSRLRTSAVRVTPGASRSGLLMLQTCLSVILVIGAGLLLRSLIRLAGVDPGFRPDNLLTAQLSLSPNRFPERSLHRDYVERLLDWLGRQGDVEAVTISSRLPLTYDSGGMPFFIEGRPYGASSATPQYVHFQIVGLRYFSMLKIPLLAGRDFDERDRDPQRPVAIVNAALARDFFPGEDPIGKRILLGAPRPGVEWRTIIGVVGDVRTAGLSVPPLPQMYEPYAQSPVRNITLIIHARTGAALLGQWLEQAMAAFDREQPVYAISTMERRVEESLAQPRFRTTLFTAFGGLAFFMAAFGIYSITAFRIAQRAKDIAIRIAIGATARQIRRWVLRQALLPVGFGLAAGLIGALDAGRVLSGFLYEISPLDPAVYAVSSVLFLSVALLAGLLPAERAARLEPSITLRLD